MIKNLFTNFYIFLFFVISIEILTFCGEVYNSSYLGFQRSGSLIVVLGYIMSIRKLLSMSVKDAIDNEYIICGGNASTDYGVIRKEARKNIRGAYIGSLFMIIGSFQWGYGDLFFK